jgi:hypothetical protein
MTIESVIGVRPNFLRMATAFAPLWRRLWQRGHTLIHTERSYDDLP